MLCMICYVMLCCVVLCNVMYVYMYVYVYIYIFFGMGSLHRRINAALQCWSCLSSWAKNLLKENVICLD